VTKKEQDKLEADTREQVVAEIEAAMVALFLALSVGLPAELAKAIESSARVEARRFVAEIVTVQINAMAKQIERGLADGLSQSAIVDDLVMTVGQTAQDATALLDIRNYVNSLKISDEAKELLFSRFAEKLKKQRIDTITGDQAWNVLSALRHEHAKKTTEEKRWVTVGDDRVCPLCHGNEAQGGIPIEQAFQSGHQYPTAHPRCRCVLSYASNQGKEKGRAVFGLGPEMAGVPNQ
jgi:hypothetical protein